LLGGSRLALLDVGEEAHADDSEAAVSHRPRPLNLDPPPAPTPEGLPGSGGGLIGSSGGNRRLSAMLVLCFIFSYGYHLHSARTFHYHMNKSWSLEYLAENLSGSLWGKFLQLPYRVCPRFMQSMSTCYTNLSTCSGATMMTIRATYLLFPLDRSMSHRPWYGISDSMGPCVDSIRMFHFG